MILEEIDGDVKVILEGRTLAIGDSFEDDKYPFAAVVGVGKAIFRVSPSTTTERKAAEMVAIPYTDTSEPVLEPVLEPTPNPEPDPIPPVVEAAPVAARVTPAMETPGEDTEA